MSHAMVDAMVYQNSASYVPLSPMVERLLPRFEEPRESHNVWYNGWPKQCCVRTPVPYR